MCNIVAIFVNTSHTRVLTRIIYFCMNFEIIKLFIFFLINQYTYSNIITFLFKKHSNLNYTGADFFYFATNGQQDPLHGQSSAILVGELAFFSFYENSIGHSI